MSESESESESELHEYLEHIQPDPEDFKANYDAACVQKIGNFASSDSRYLFEYKGKDRKHLTWEVIKYVSPKLFELMHEIKRQDAEDMRVHGRKFKHFVFSTVKSGTHGAKIVASALIDLFDMQLGYSASNKLISEGELAKNKGKNFYLLSSVAVHGKPLSVSMRKEILRRFNSRPDNVYGDMARIIVMDAGFKEGIDLFDIKYVHIFEPQSTMADQKQVIGRGTRTCGQKGLEFHPTQGWPLYVNIYDLVFPEDVRFKFKDAATVHQLYLKSLGIDLRMLNLMADMERVSMEGAIDADLNRPIHEFSNIKGGSKTKQIENVEDDIHMAGVSTLLGELPYDSDRARKMVNDVFENMKWEKPVMKNLCGGGLLDLNQGGPEHIKGGDPTMMLDHSVDLTDAQSYFSKGGGGASTVMTLNPTQDFISHYFSPELNRKGMLLSHSVGTGKTCTAIATATRSFEQAGYTILWVTRTTLKNDIWKNMFDQICSVSIGAAVESGTITQSQLSGENRMKLLSKSWFIKPMSYKQFTNLVSKNNDFYKQLVKKNGVEDPLRKTLLIIDEAHKLYGESDLGGAERPNVTALYDAIMRSYEVSGADSVRLLLMTATPITSSPMELVQLLNLCRERTARISDNFNVFAQTYLDDAGKFTQTGERRFKNEIAGHISYLNRERDARMFSQPVIKQIAVPILNEQPLYEGYDAQIIREINAKRLDDIKDDIDDGAAIAAGITKLIEQTKDDINLLCDKHVNLAACKKIAKTTIKNVKTKLTSEKKNVSNKVKELRGEYNILKKAITQKIKHIRDIAKRSKIGDAIKPSELSLASKSPSEYLSSNLHSSNSQKSSIRSNSSSLYTGSLKSSPAHTSSQSKKSSIRSNSSSLYTGSLRSSPVKLGGGINEEYFNDSNDYQKYIQSVFYNLKQKCKRASSRKGFNTNPHIIELSENIEAYQKEIAELKKHLMEVDKNNRLYIANLKKQIKKSTDMTDKLEDELEKYDAEMAQNTQNARMRITMMQKQLKTTIKNKEKYQTALEKAYKKAIKTQTVKNKKDRKEKIELGIKANELEYAVGNLAKETHAKVHKIVDEEEDEFKIKIDMLPSDNHNSVKKSPKARCAKGTKKYAALGTGCYTAEQIANHKTSKKVKVK